MNGKKVILFIDEYDKSRTETDPFLLNFLQDGEIDTTQQGKIKIKEEYLRNLQVIICKNNERELSGPLSRRLKALKLDYMKPSLLAKTINKQLSNSNQPIKDSVIMLYTTIYNEHTNGVYVFERVPSCSECMQAIKDAEMLIEMGADKEDIVTTAIVANLFKTENDIETFKSLLKNSKNNEFIKWYEYLVEVVGRNSEDELEEVKAEMARSFYPEQLKIVTKELEEKKRELDIKTKQLEQTTKEHEQNLKKITQEQQRLEKKEQDLQQREEETKKLRKNAKQDALQSAQQHIETELEKLKQEYEQKNKNLQQREEKVRKLRETAEQDALQKAEEKIDEERGKVQQEFEKKAKELENRVAEQIATANEQIEQNNRTLEERLTDYTYIKSAKEEAEQLLQESEANIQKQKQLLEKLLGREVTKSDFQETEQTTTIQIGEIELETNDEKEQLKFTNEASQKLGEILTKEKFKKQNPMVCDDGIVLYQGMNNKVVAVRVIREENGEFKNSYVFYSNLMVTPIQAFQMIVNLVANLNACGIEIIDVTHSKPIPMQLNCLLCSNKEHHNTPECIYEKIDENIYHIKYENKSETVPLTIAKFLISSKGINCSVKELTTNELEQIEKKAFIKHCELTNGKKTAMIEKVPTLSIPKIGTKKEEELEK